MHFQIDLKPYKRQLKTPLITASHTYHHREGFIIRLKTPQNTLGYGEIVLSAARGGATKNIVIDLFQSIPSPTPLSFIQTIPTHLFNLNWAFSSALSQAYNNLPTALSSSKKLTILLNNGLQGISSYSKYYSEGFRHFKWKIGVNPIKEEIYAWDAWSEQLHPDTIIRLDANGNLTEQDLIHWSKKLDANPQIEFLEQPFPPNDLQKIILYSKKSSIPLAIDESLQLLDNYSTLDSLKWNGFVIIKPVFLNSIPSFLKWRESTSAKCIYSSALETIFGLTPALHLAFSDSKNAQYAIGFGIHDYTTDDILSSPYPIQNGQLHFTPLPQSYFDQLWNQL